MDTQEKYPTSVWESGGPMIDACQWYKSSPTGPAEHDDGGSLSKKIKLLVYLLYCVYQKIPGIGDYMKMAKTHCQLVKAK